MKRLLKHLLPLILIIGSAFGQLSGTGYNASRTFVTTSVAADTGISENSSIGWHQIGWTVTGSPASCTVKLQTSPDNTTWTDLITGTCTTNGQSAISAQTLAAYVRIDVTALSASSSVQVQYLGWAYNPNPGGGGSGTVTSITCGTGATCSPTTITTTGIISASGGSSAFSSATVTVTSAQLKALNTTSVQLVAGVAGHYFSPIQATVEYVFGTTAYTVTGFSSFSIGIGATANEVLLGGFNTAGFVDQTSSQVMTVPIAAAGAPGQINAVTDVTGLGIYLETLPAGSALTLGNGTLKITVIYQDTTL